MSQNILESIFPWAICLVVAVIAARLLIAASGAKLKLARLRSIHRSQKGSVQSLSFVLTLPFFVMILMLIIQVSQIMFGNIVVHYAAFAAVRSASVWIPANVSSYETANRVSSLTLINSTPDGQQFLVSPAGEKFSKIHQAATLACMPLGPSRNLGYELDPASQSTHEALSKQFRGANPNSRTNDLISTRLRNKLAYSYPNTSVQLTLWHRYKHRWHWWSEPPLQVRYDVPPYRDEYYLNEVGWQDELTAQVMFNLPLLPGPVRFFAPTGNFATIEGVNPAIDASGETFIWPISASATMGVEGEKPLISIWQEEF